MRRPSAARRALFWSAGAVASVGLGLCIAFALNGLDPTWREPRTHDLDFPERAGPVRELKVVAFNLAKAGFHRGGLDFAPRSEVRARLDVLADFLRAEEVDLAFLSEVVHEAGPAPQDQALHVARRAGFPHLARSDNYSFGLPGYRIRSGNALLSRLPLEALETIQLHGAKPIWNPTNNRRALWCNVRIGSSELLVASLRNDSFDAEVNRFQALQILDRSSAAESLLAGDFNASSNSAAMQLFALSERFGPFPQGPPTHPARAPRLRLDHVLAPRGWQRIEERLIDLGTSDHLAVFVRFGLP